MKTQTVTITPATSVCSTVQTYTAQVTLRAAPFAVPSEGELKAIRREADALLYKGARA